MKKILFLLLFTVSFYGQTLQNPTYGVVTEKNNATNSTPTYFVTQEVDGVHKKTPAANIALKTDLNKKQFLSTGLVKNGLISINTDPTKYNITAGIGIITNFDDPENPTCAIINFPATTGKTPTYLNTGNITYVAVNSSGVVVEQATAFTTTQRRDLIILGAVIHSNLTTINVVNNISAPTNADTNQLQDLMTYIGALNLTGNKYTANGANLSLDKSAGSIFKAGVNFATDWKRPHELDQAAGTALTFRYRTQNGTESGDLTTLNPAVYDLSNVLTAVPSNKFTIQTVTMFQTGLTRLQYGQSYYNTLEEAQNAILTRNYVVESNIAMNGLTRAYIILRNTTTSLQNAADAKIVEAQKFGGVASGGVALTDTAIIAALGYTPENSANKQNSLAVDGTGTKYPTVDAVNAALPVNYAVIVYVNSTSPNTATIFDDANPPTVNDDALKLDVDNLYIGTDASTWVYNGSNYVTKVVPASSNFFLYGTTTDAGSDKTSDITRNGALILDRYISTNSGIVSKMGASNTVSSGSFLRLIDSPQSNGNQFQLNASNGLDLWNLTSGVWNKRATFSSAGNLTANSFIIPSGTGSQFLMADGSTLSTTVLPVTETGTSFSLTDAYNGKVVIFTGSCTVTIPNGLVANFECSFVTLTGVTLTVATGGSVVLHNNVGTTMTEKLSCTIKQRTTANNYITVGNL